MRPLYFLKLLRTAYGHREKPEDSTFAARNLSGNLRKFLPREYLSSTGINI